MKRHLPSSCCWPTSPSSRRHNLEGLHRKATCCSCLHYYLFSHCQQPCSFRLCLGQCRFEVWGGLHIPEVSRPPSETCMPGLTSESHWMKNSTPGLHERKSRSSNDDQQKEIDLWHKSFCLSWGTLNLFISVCFWWVRALRPSRFLSFILNYQTRGKQ